MLFLVRSGAITRLASFSVAIEIRLLVFQIGDGALGGFGGASGRRHFHIDVGWWKQRVDEEGRVETTL